MKSIFRFSVRAIALAVIGGQTLCLLITPLFTAVAFSLFDDIENWFRSFRKPPTRLKLVEPTFDGDLARHAAD